MESSIRLKENNNQFVTFSKFEDEMRKVRTNAVTIRKNYLNIRIFMPSSSGGFDIDIPGAIVDSGAQVCLLLE